MLGALVLAWLPVVAQPVSAPSTDEALRAFGRVSEWVRAGAVTPGSTTTNTGACAVTLRLIGERIGSGQAIGPGSVPTAAEQAIESARTRLGTIAEGERWTAAADQMTISIQVAGPFVPLDRATLDSEMARLEPGIDGVAVRIGERVEAFFPGTAAERSMTAPEAITALFSVLTDDPTSALRPIGDSLAQTKATIYRFRVRQLVQLAPGAIPFEVSRGGRIVAVGEVTTDMLREMGDGIASHLIGRRTDNDDLPGMYLPTTGRYSPDVGNDLERVVVAYALLRYARTEGVDPGLAVDARLRAFDLLDRVSAAVEQIEDPLVAAFAMSAVAEAQDQLGGIEGVGSLQDLVGLSSSALDGAFDDGFGEDLPTATYGAIALGLAARASITGDSDQLEIARRAILETYTQTEPGKLVSQMPWLVLAERRAGSMTGQAVQGATALRSMRALVWEHQLVEDSGTPLDLGGGIVFTTRPGVRPDWSSLRAISAAAVMLGDPTLTEPDEVLPETARLVRSLRYLRQLCADRVVGHMYVDPDRAMWGVRSSVWSQQMRSDASALGLITACESLDALSRIEARRGGEQP